MAAISAGVPMDREKEHRTFEKGRRSKKLPR